MTSKDLQNIKFNRLSDDVYYLISNEIKIIYNNNNISTYIIGKCDLEYFTESKTIYNFKPEICNFNINTLRKYLKIEIKELINI